MRARHRAARALLARGRRLARRGHRGLRGRGRGAGRARRRARGDRAGAGAGRSCRPRAGASRATSRPGARRRRPSWRGGRARRSCGCWRKVGGHPRPRALRELLALQASDWAFGVTHETAGPYSHERADGHAAELERALADPAGMGASTAQPCTFSRPVKPSTSGLGDVREIGPHSAELCAYSARLLELNTAESPPDQWRGAGDPLALRRPGRIAGRARRSAGLSASPTANPVGIKTQEVAVPFIDPANPGPWLASLSASRRRRADAARQARRRRAGRGGGAALLAAMTLVAGGAVAQDGPRHHAAQHQRLGDRGGAAARARRLRRRRHRARSPGARSATTSATRASRSTASPARPRSRASASPRSAAPARPGPGDRGSGGSRHARQDRPVRVRRRPDRGLLERPVPRQVPVLPRHLARPRRQAATRPRRPSRSRTRWRRSCSPSAARALAGLRG